MILIGSYSHERGFRKDKSLRSCYICFVLLLFRILKQMDSGLIFMHRVQDYLEFKAKNNEFSALETQRHVAKWFGRGIEIRWQRALVHPNIAVITK